MHALEILLVDGSAKDAALIRYALSEMPVRLHIARDGHQALLMLTIPHVHLNLIILDLNIPDIAGTALLERWKVGATPVVVFTASANPADKERCLALGAREFVAKPTNFEQLSEAVRRIVDTWATPEKACSSA